jgi:hypothetical protein
MAGSGAGAGLIVLYATAAIEQLRARIRAAWLPIALRVAAAWVAAISLMMLALALAPETETKMPAASRRGAAAELPAAAGRASRNGRRGVTLGSSKRRRRVTFPAHRQGRATPGGPR